MLDVRWWGGNDALGFHESKGSGRDGKWMGACPYVFVSVPGVWRGWGVVSRIWAGENMRDSYEARPKRGKVRGRE